MAKYSFIAGEDLTGKVGYAIKGGEAGVQVQTAPNGACLGILMNDNVQNGAVGVALVGEVVKAKLGGTVAQGDFLACNSAGKLIGHSTGERVAQALEAGVSGDLIYVVVTAGVK